MMAGPLLTALSPDGGRTTPGCSQSYWWLNHSWLLPVLLVLNLSWLLSILLVAETLLDALNPAGVNHFWQLSILLMLNHSRLFSIPDGGRTTPDCSQSC
jgi:hypothetical protein